MHYIEKSLPLRRLDFFDCRLEADFEYGYGSRSDAVLFILSYLSLKTSLEKADPEYKPRIQAALAGVNEKST